MEGRRVRLDPGSVLIDGRDIIALGPVDEMDAEASDVEVVDASGHAVIPGLHNSHLHSGLLRGTAWAHKALYTLVGWFGLVGPAFAAMAIAMEANNDPNASFGSTAFMIALGIAFLTLAVYVYRPLFRPPTNTD